MADRHYSTNRTDATSICLNLAWNPYFDMFSSMPFGKAAESTPRSLLIVSRWLVVVVAAGGKRGRRRSGDDRGFDGGSGGGGAEEILS